MRKSLRRTQRRKQKTQRRRRLQKGGARVGFIYTVDMINAAKSDMNMNIDTKIRKWINTYFLGNYLVFIKNDPDSTRVIGRLTKMEHVNMNEDTYVLRVENSEKNSTIPLDDIINNVYKAIIISDLDRPRNYSILESPTLREYVFIE